MEAPIKYLIFIIVSVFLAHSAVAGQRLRLNGVTIKTTPSGQVLAAFNLGCGGTFKGFVVNAYGDELEVGALVLSDAITCSAINQPMVAPLPGVHAKSFRRYYSVRSRMYPGNFRSIAFSKIHLSPVRASGEGNKFRKGFARIQGIYQSKCGQSVGVVLAGSHETVRLGILEYIGLAKPKCDPEMNIATLEGIKVLRGLKKTKFEVIGDFLARKHNPYVVKLTTVKDNKLFKLSPKRAGFQYRRLCNQAPIGPVIMPDYPAKKVYVGMLVAEYGERVCPKGKGAEPEWRTQRFPASQIPEGFAISIRQPKRGQLSVDLLPPHAIESAKNSSYARFMGSCGQVIGLAVIERQNETAVGLVQATNKPRVARCARPLKALSYRLGKVDYGRKGLSPLRLVDNF